MNDIQKKRSWALLLASACLLTAQPAYVYASTIVPNASAQTSASWRNSAKAAAIEAIPFIQAYYAERDPANMIGWASLALDAAGLPLTAENDGGAIKAKQTNIEESGVGVSTTDYDSLLLGVIAAGQNPRSFGRVDLLSCLLASERPNGKFADRVSGGGEDLVNAQLWSIIALHAAGQSIPNADEALTWLTAHQHQDGSFNWSVSAMDPDIDTTAMALLAYHALGQDGTNPAVQRAFQFLQHVEQQSGAFGDAGQASAESTAVVVETLVASGMDPTSSPWQKAQGNPVQALLSFRTKDGSFSHVSGGTGNIMATVQAVTALGDYGKGQSIYDGLFSKNTIVKESWKPAFNDLPLSNPNYANLSLLVGMGVLAGYGDQSMRPSASVTREQFAKMLVYALGDKDQQPPAMVSFQDVSQNRWSYADIGIAAAQGWVKGYDAHHFGPQKNITGAELLTMLVQALGKSGEAKAWVGSNWYDGYVRVAQNAGLTYPGFAPTRDATRANCAYSLARLLRTQGN